MRTLMFCAAFAMPFSVWAQPSDPVATPTPEAVDQPAVDLPDVIEEIPPGQEVGWAISTAKALHSAANEKLWGPFASILIMALLSLFSFLFLRFRDLRTTLRPYMGEVALIVSVFGYVALGLGTLPADADFGAWWGVIGPGLKTGLAAVGSWELIVKRLWKHWGPKLWALIKRLFGK